MTVEEYRQRMIDTFHNADCDELIALVVQLEEKEFEHLEWLLKNHYHNQKQEPCDDVISRKMALKECYDIVIDGERYSVIQEETLLGLPPVIPNEKTGKWIDEADKIDAQFGKHTYKCSECGKYAEYFVSGTEVWWDRIKPNFCPNCGAKMIEPQESAKIDCSKTKCENCTNHNYCDFEPQESEVEDGNDD